MIWQSFGRIFTHRYFVQCSQKVFVRGISLSYKIVSDRPADPDAPPILLLHDVLSWKRRWESLGKTILNLTKRSVVAVDLRNHGESPHANTHRYAEQVQDILGLYEKLSIREATLIGHGVGGRASMCLALMAPEKVVSLLVIDISPVSNSKHLLEYYPKLMTAMANVQFDGFKKVHKAQKHVKHLLRGVAKDDATMKSILTNIYVKPNQGIAWRCNLEVLSKNFKYIASFPKEVLQKSYHGPCLFVGGQLSEYIPPDDLTDIRQMFPRAVVKYIPKTGHNLQNEDPKSFMELAIAFLKINEHD